MVRKQGKLEDCYKKKYLPVEDLYRAFLQKGKEIDSPLSVVLPSNWIAEDFISKAIDKGKKSKQGYLFYWDSVFNMVFIIPP